MESSFPGGGSRRGFLAEVPSVVPVPVPTSHRWLTHFNLNWVTIDDAGTATLFRRAKLCLVGVPPAILAEAARTGLLVGRLGLTDPKGNPTCPAAGHQQSNGPLAPPDLAHDGRPYARPLPAGPFAVPAPGPEA